MIDEELRKRMGIAYISRDTVLALKLSQELDQQVVEVQLSRMKVQSRNEGRSYGVQEAEISI
ncbi:MAG: hypothetical protein K0R80_1592 [Clostridia bacterium]|jgi:hypothetical protein|nr:hypothetical protein [Clostridia bacterium]